MHTELEGLRQDLRTMAAETAGVLLLGEEEYDDGALRRLCGEAAPEVEVAARRVQVYIFASQRKKW
mgnify:CR=1 FL=1